VIGNSCSFVFLDKIKGVLISFFLVKLASFVHFDFPMISGSVQYVYCLRNSIIVFHFSDYKFQRGNSSVFVAIIRSSTTGDITGSHIF